ncbi:MAG: hypothetical protein HY832_00245 [Candidatus Aenigmarchaeota archaeon]|nr:hypothetical protein [Candidatus Aenigmarchaeota archaeon]
MRGNHVIVKLLSLLDLIATLLIGLHLLFGLFPLSTVILVPYYFILKGAIFTLGKDVASAVDLVCGIYLLLAVYGLFSSGLMTIIVFVWLFQKSFFGVI